MGWSALFCQDVFVIKKFFKKIWCCLFRIPKPVLYQIGNLKHQNARVDGFSPMLVKIGDDFVSAPGSIILSHDASTFMHTGKYRVEKTVIGDKVFLGANAIILPGVKVGDGAIIGAGAVVTNDVPPYVVVAGNPAKKICTVEEYVAKCDHRGCLYEPPEEFKILLEDGRPSIKAKINFQKDILKTLEEHNED